MRLSQRHFPHPVLSDFSDDMPGKTFSYDLQIKPTADGTAYTFYVEFLLTSRALNELVDTRRASFALHVECPATRFRRLWETNEPRLELTIDLDQLDGEVQINGLVLAAQNLDDYNSKEFNPDYAGHAFHVRQGDILALAKPRRFYPNKLDARPSIFALSRSQVANAPEITYGLGQDLIVIEVPEALMKTYANLEKYQEHRPVLNSITAFPVLVSVLHTLQRRDEQDPNEFDELHEPYRNHRWYQVLGAALSKMGIKDWFIDDPVSTANELLDFVVGKAFSALEEQELSRGQELGSDDE